MRALISTRRLLALTGAALTVGLLLLPVPVRAAQDDSITVQPQAESWYRPIATARSLVPNTCELPVIGCGPATPSPPVPPPSPYPPGFLHVGVGAGIEESRTYLALDLSSLPFDAVMTGGTLTLPITTDPTAGVALADAAKVRACHVGIFIRDGAAGDLTGAPEVDCTLASSASYVAPQGGEPASLVVDLSPFIEAWAGGLAALALVPEEGLAPSENWHVAFSRRDRQAADAVPISARLDLAGEDADAVPDVQIELPPAVVTEEFDLPLTDDSDFEEFPDVGATFAAPPVDRAQLDQSGRTAAVAPVAQAQPVVFVVGGRFAYPAMFLLPLGVAAAIAWAGRAFTRDLQSPTA